MTMANTENGIKIVGGIANIANAVNKKFNRDELNALLNLFGHKTAGDEEYALPGKLVNKAMEYYTAIGDMATMENISSVFKNVDFNLLK